MFGICFGHLCKSRNIEKPLKPRILASKAYAFTTTLLFRVSEDWSVYQCTSAGRKLYLGGGGMTKKNLSSGIIFLGYRSNFQKSGGGGHALAPWFLRHCNVVTNNDSRMVKFRKGKVNVFGSRQIKSK